jgi:hypothetical protein
MHLKISLAALMATALIVAGCGGDDTTTTSSSSTTAAGASGASGASGAAGEVAGGGLLPDDFAADANAICVAGNDEIDAAGAEQFGGSNQEPSQADQQSFVNEILIPSIRGQIDALRALGDPDEGAEELSAVLDDAESALQEIEDDPSLLTGESDPFAGIDDQFKELGLPACAD